MENWIRFCEKCGQETKLVQLFSSSSYECVRNCQEMTVMSKFDKKNNELLIDYANALAQSKEWSTLAEIRLNNEFPFYVKNKYSDAEVIYKIKAVRAGTEWLIANYDDGRATWMNIDAIDEFKLI